MSDAEGIEILDQIPFKLETEFILRRLPLHGDKQRFAGLVRELIVQVTPIARPKAVYKISCLGKKYLDIVEIDGVRFTSRVLRVNLEPLKNVFPFVATCGREVDNVAVPDDGMMTRYCLDIIKTMIVMEAVNYLRQYIAQKYSLKHLAVMNPGELESWPLSQQQELFSVLGNVEKMIDVTLTGTGTLSPIKSRSGIFFESESKFENCLLCQNKACIGRKAAYNPGIVSQFEKRYGELSDKDKP